jgi:hypothetical protein
VTIHSCQTLSSFVWVFFTCTDDSSTFVYATLKIKTAEMIAKRLLQFLLQHARLPTVVPKGIAELCNHRDTYLEQQQTEKIETEVRDVDRIRITKVSLVAFWGVIIRALLLDINICYTPSFQLPTNK